MKNSFRPKVKKKGKIISPARAVSLGFALVILIGGILLSLPISSRTGEWTNFLDSIFTATSATCVTGLVIYDTYSHWNGFGQMIILLLIQIGGLGFMTLFTLFSFLFRRTITVKERLVMTASLNISDISGVVRLTRRILYGTFFFEAVGAIVLSIRFSRDFGMIDGIKKGIFHSISAFCNAGFDLMGEVKPFSSLMNYSDDFVINFTITTLIIVGGLGFFVWNDLHQQKGVFKLELHTKIVLITTALLIVGGTVLFFIFEYNNPATMKDMPLYEKIYTSFFQSVTCRTAGFNTIDQSAITGQSIALSIILFFIGGSPGSTAGGIKTVTAAVLLLTAIAIAKGRSNVNLFNRRISARSIMNSVTMLVMGIFLVTSGTFVISMMESVPIGTAAFEAASAFGTVGLTMGITPALSSISKIAVIVLMFLGRVGILTLGVAVLMRQTSEPKLKYPEGRVMIG